MLHRRPSEKRRNRLTEAAATVVASVLLALAYLPVYCMLTLSLKPGRQLYTDFWGLPRPPVWGAYRVALEKLLPGMVNSVLCVLAACFIMLVLSLLSGYVFARLRFPGRELLYLLVTAMLMIPSVLTLTASFTLTKTYHIYNTWWALILPWAATGQIWGILLVRNHMEGLPRELFESARMDGCGELQCLLRIALPLSWPILATAVVIKIVDFYSDFIWPLIVIQDSAKQVITVLIRMYSGNVAGYVITTIPLLLLFAAAGRLYIEGLTAGAVKQ